MSVRVDGALIRLEGDCRVEEAEALAAALDAAPSRPVDLSACRSMHGAVAQVLLVYRAVVSGEPPDVFLKDHVLPNFQALRASSRDA